LTANGGAPQSGFELPTGISSYDQAIKRGIGVSSQRFREKLLELQAELLAAAEAGNASAAVVELDQTKVGRLSRMDAMQAQAMAQASEQRREQTLRQIAAALKRIDDDEYGYCLKCDEAINPKRLEFDPTVTLCIECASRAEA
jgi:DnaK suppressor protein